MHIHFQMVAAKTKWNIFMTTAIVLTALQLNIDQIAMESTGFTHVGEPLTGQLISPAAGRKAGPVKAFGH